MNTVCSASIGRWIERRRMALTALSLLAMGVCYVSGQTFDQLPNSASVVEGGSAEFSCTVLSNDSSPTRLDSVWAILMPGRRRTEQLLGINNINMTDLEDGSTAYIRAPFNSPLTIANVTQSLDGTRVRCLFIVGIDPTFQPEPYAFLTVLVPPVYTFFPNQPTTVLEGEDYTFSFGFEAKPTPTNFTWSRDGQVISSGGRIATSVSTISITSTTRSDSGVYEVMSYNEAGSGAGNFTLDVQYPPELTTPLSPVFLITGTSFSFNCTPSAANPPVDTVSIEVDSSPVTSNDTVTVTGNILTIPSVQRSHSGNYSCTATNTRGSAVIYQHLLVTDGVPLIAGVAVRFVTSSSSLEVVTHLTTNGGRNVLHYYIVLNGVTSVFSGGNNQSVLSATVSTGGPRHRGEEGEEWSVSVVVENELGNSSEVVVVLQGQPSSVSDAVTVADMSSAVIGLSVTVALVIVISVTIVIISLVVIIVLCHRQASYRVKLPSLKMDDYQMEDIKEVKLESNPAYEAVNTS